MSPTTSPVVIGPPDVVPFPRLEPPFDPQAWPIVPTIDESLKARLRAIFLDGQADGNRIGVFAKAGDSITATTEFLVDVGCSSADLGHHTDLAVTIASFQVISVPPGDPASWCGASNSFTRTSLAAEIGWRSDEVLAPSSTPPDPSCEPAKYDTPLTCELHVLRPSIALIMFGTNDMSHDDVPFFAQEMTKIVRATIALGVIPVLSTVPPRPGDPTMDSRVAQYNAAILQVGRTERVPVWNYWLALAQPNMLNEGIGGDGVHPNSYGACIPRCQASDFTDEGLRFGFNQRNFTALEVLRKIQEVVFYDGAADAGPQVQIVDGTVSPKVVLAAPGQPVRWSFDAGNTLQHTVSDASGLGLFDSGHERPGSSFEFAFQAAASYGFVCRLHPTLMTGTVGVPVAVSPTATDVEAPVGVTWSSGPPPPGLVFDVQVLRPGADWADWRMGRTAPQATFRAALPGTYAFQARLRDPSTGIVTGWSPPVHVVVGPPRSSASV